MAIATRHADAVDVKFLVNGRPVWIALAHPAWLEHQKKTGHVITDPLAVEIAGHYLRSILEDGEESGRDLYTLSVAETLQHLDAVLKEAGVTAGSFAAAQTVFGECVFGGKPTYVLGIPLRTSAGGFIYLDR